MLKAYKYVETDLQKLHHWVLDFFRNIEFETAPFSISFFDEEFREIVNRHRTILRQEFKAIYEELRSWEQEPKSRIIGEILESNEISDICAGSVDPKKIEASADGIYKSLRSLFLKLYKNVLDGDPIHDTIKVTLRNHFESFRKENNSITLCPMCGISELKTEFDISRDQYDHYLPKAIYPLSAINFYNLVLTCKECNSFDVKGEKDVINFRRDRLFYPFDEECQGIEIQFQIEAVREKNEDFEWSVELTSKDGKIEEVDAWKNIYNIEKRYLGFVKGRIEKWYKAYWGFQNSSQVAEWSDDEKLSIYFSAIGQDEKECLDYIRMPAIREYLSKVDMVEAESQARLYS